MGYDPDLTPILRSATDEELMPLVDYLLKKASNSIDIDPIYQAHPNKPHLYADLIADEIRAMGGNSIVNFFRGEGVSYHEVVCDVAKKLKIRYDKTQSVEEIEEYILYKILSDSWDKMSNADKEQFLMTTPIGTSNKFNVATMTFQTLVQLGGFKPYQIAVIVANAAAKSILGHGLQFATNAGLTHYLSVFAGPVGWTLSGIWLAINLAGPSYKTTIPCVIQIAMIRKAHKDDTKILIIFGIILLIIAVVIILLITLF